MDMKNSTMKKMMIALCIGIFTIAACSKKNGPGGPSDSNTLLLSEIIVGDAVIQRLEYNDKNLVTKQILYSDSKHVGTRTYTYNSANLPVRIVNNINNTDPIIEDYIYDSKGIIQTGTLTTGDDGWSMTFKKEKNSLIHTSISSDGELININTYTFDDKGNLLKMEFTNNGVSAGVNEWFGYDNKKGVAGSIGDAVFMLFSSPNNPTKSRHSYLNTVIEYDYQFTYNDAGYPTIMTRYKKDTKEIVDITNYKYIPAQ